MGICYLCGENMVDRVLEQPNNQMTSKIRHEEHIIQNALYGRLTDCNILCEDCGSKLSRDVDSNFCKAFDGIIEQIKHILASKDHGNNKYNKTLKGFITKSDGQKISVQIKNGKVSPIKPEYDYLESANLVNIYAPYEIAKNYVNWVKKDLISKGYDINSITFEIKDDISDFGDLGINFSEGIENFDLVFKLGLNKIATGFAIANGITREQVPRTLDTIDKKIIFSSNVIPFCAIGPFDFLLEPFRPILEKEYPSHTLILYTENHINKKLLVCYIDLFSTFQFYVILNDNYKGDSINKIYYQTIDLLRWEA